MTTKISSYDKYISHRSVDAEIDRLASQAQKGWPKESRTLSWLGLEDGMSVVELGSGPGFITEQLRVMLPESKLTCIENDPELIKQAKIYLKSKSIANVNFIEASVEGSELPDNKFDIAYARLLYQHLENPVKVSQEIYRILKPGGKLIVHDIDDGLFGIFNPQIAELERIVEAFGKAQKSRGGNRHIGRALWDILESVGFDSLDLEVLSSHSGDVGIEPFMQQLDPARFQPLVEDNFLNDKALERFILSRESFMKTKGAFAIWLSFMVSAQKVKDN